MNTNRLALLLIMVVALVAIACAPVPAATPVLPAPTTASSAVAEPAEFDWRKYEGETIRFLVHDFAAHQDYKKMLPEFEEKTGIKVIWDQASGFDLNAKILLEFIANPANVDAFLLSWENTGVKLMKEGWIEDLTSYINDPSMTNPEFDFDDFLPPGKLAVQKNGIITGIPDYIHFEFLAYRKDIFEKNGWTCADIDTYEKLKEVAIKLNDPSNEFYGASYRGGGYASAWPFSNWMWSYGGDWLDKEGKPSMASPEVIQAATMYGDILRLGGPPGPKDLDDGRNRALFNEGKLAIWLAGAQHLGSTTDPSQSKVTDKIGFCKNPGGPAGTYSNVTAPAWSISSGSTKKGASWYFIQWLTSKEMQRQQQVKNALLMSRKSAWEDPEFLAKANPEYLKAANETFTIGRNPPLPPAQDVAAVRTAIGKALEVAISGGDVAAAFAEANKEYQRLIDKPLSLATPTPKP